MGGEPAASACHYVAVDPLRLFSPQPGAGGLPSEAAADARAGRLGDETLQMQDEPPGLNTDSLEEITLHFAEKAESERLDEEDLQPAPEDRLLTLQQIQTYLESAHERPREGELQALAQQLRQGPDHPRRQLQGRDPMQAFLALQLALGEGGAGPERTELLQDTLAALEQDHGPRIAAQLGSAASLTTVSRDGADFQAQQARYVDLVIGRATLAQTLDGLLERFGPDGGEAALKEGLQAFAGALGAQLATARGGSTDPARLSSLVGDLHQCSVLATALGRAQQLDADLRRTVAHPGVDATALLRDLVRLTGERYVAAARFQPLVQRFGGQTPTHAVALLTGVKGLLRDLPTPVYPDLETRQTHLTALQTALDDAIAREEDQT